MSIDPKPAPLPKEFTDAVKSIGKYYMYDYKGIRIDPYRILSVYGIVCPAMQHAIKKLLRCGKSIKTEREDILEVMSTLERKLEMLNEDSNMQSEERRNCERTDK